MKNEAENKVAELLRGSNSEDKRRVALSILFLKYKMIEERGVSLSDMHNKSFINMSKYEEQIQEIENHFSIKIGDENPFSHEIVRFLESKACIETLITAYSNRDSEYLIRINMPHGAQMLRNMYQARDFKNLLD